MTVMSNGLSGAAWLVALETEAVKLSGRFDGLARQVQALGGVGDPVLLQAVADFGAAVEELHVTQEELRLQASALADAHGSLEAARQRYQTLFEFLPDACLLSDPAGRVQDANHAVSALIGYARTYLVGKPILALTAPESVQLYLTRLRTLAEQTHDRIQEWEMSLRGRRTSESTLVSVRVRPLRDAAGAIAGFIWLLRDITEARALATAYARQAGEREREIRTHTAELQAVARMRGAALELETADHARLRAEVRGIAEQAIALLQQGEPSADVLASLSRSLLTAVGEAGPGA